MDSSIFIPATVQVLGINENFDVYLWSSANREMYQMKNFTELDRSRLIQIAGLDEIMRIERMIYLTVSKDANPVMLMRDAIAEASRGHRFQTDESIGQGVWRNPVGKGLLIVTGKSCFTFQFDGRVKVKQLGSPVVGGKLLDMGNEWITPAALQSQITSSTPNNLVAAYKELIGYLSQWNYKGASDAILVAGLVIATIIQAAFEFRPHVSVIGKTYSGKSTLRTFLHGLWPHAVSAEGKSSVYGLQEELGNDSRPLLFDEFDKHPDKALIYEWLRSSSGDGGYLRKRGMASKLRHIAWLFGIQEGLKTAADNNRFIRITLLPANDLPRPPKDVLADLGRRLLVAALIHADAISTLCAQLSTAERRYQHQRLAEVYALPLAIHGVMTRQSLAELEIMLDMILEEKNDELTDKNASDEHELLSDILHAYPKGMQSPVTKLLTDQWGNEIELGNAGFRKIERNGNTFIFLATQIIRSVVLVAAKYRDMDIKEILCTLPDSFSDRQRINGKPEHGVMIPWAVAFPPDDLPVEPADIPF